MHAHTTGYKVVFTDYSLLGFADVGSMHMNKVLQFTLADVSPAICMIHKSKENSVLSSGLPPDKFFVIPNAVDTVMFKPVPEWLNSKEIAIVVLSTLAYRKGADLLVEVIPEACQLYYICSLSMPTPFVKPSHAFCFVGLRIIMNSLFGKALHELSSAVNSVQLVPLIAHFRVV